MTINEMKSKYIKLKQLKHKLLVLTSDPFADESSRQIKIQNLEKQIKALEDTLKNLKRLYIKDLEQSFKKYFEAKNVQAEINTSVNKNRYVREDFYGEETYTHYDVKTYLIIKTKNKETKIFLTNSGCCGDDIKYLYNDYIVEGISVLDNLLKNNEDTVMLRKLFPDITDCVWNAYAISLKKKIDEKLNEQEKEKSLIQKMIASLKTPTYIANEINKLQNQVDQIDENENKLKGDIYNIDL